MWARAAWAALGFLCVCLWGVGLVNESHGSLLGAEWLPLCTKPQVVGFSHEVFISQIPENPQICRFILDLGQFVRLHPNNILVKACGERLVGFKKDAGSIGEVCFIDRLLRKSICYSPFHAQRYEFCRGSAPISELNLWLSSFGRMPAKDYPDNAGGSIERYFRQTDSGQFYCNGRLSIEFSCIRRLIGNGDRSLRVTGLKEGSYK